MSDINIMLILVKMQVFPLEAYWWSRPPNWTFGTPFSGQSNKLDGFNLGKKKQKTLDLIYQVFKWSFPYWEVFDFYFSASAKTGVKNYTIFGRYDLDNTNGKSISCIS